MFKKKKKHPSVANKEQLSVIFSRLAADSLTIKLKLGNETLRSVVIALVDDSLVTSFKRDDIERFGIKTNTVVNILFYHEGKEYYGGMKLAGAGRYEKQEAIRLQIPKVLYIKDDFGLTSFNLNPRVDVTFTNMFGQFCQGQIVNMGAGGLDMLNKESAPTKQLLAVDRACDVAFNLDDLKVYTKGRVLYINNVGEELIGVEFTEVDNKTKAAISLWIQEKTLEKAERDQQWLRGFKRGDHKQKQPPKPTTARTGPQLREEYKVLKHEGSPMVLILSRDTDMLARMGKCLQRKFGVMISKGRFSNVKEILAHYQPDLLLVSEVMGTISGFDLVSTIKEQIPDAPPMVLLGEREEDACLAEAVTKGAVGYWNIATFRPLTFFKNVEETFAKLVPAEENDPDETEEGEAQQEQPEDEPNLPKD